MTIELVSYADLKSLLGLEEALITAYPDLSLIKDSVVTAIESYLDRDLDYGEYQDNQFFNKATAYIKLNALPIESVESVIVKQSGEATTLTADDYMIMNYGLFLYSPSDLSSVSIEYTGGYADDDVPTPIKRAALIQTTYEFQSKDHIGASSVTNEGGSVQRPEIGLLKEVRRLLDRYKHPLSWA